MDQTMILPEGGEISFDFGGFGGRSLSNKRMKPENKLQCQVFSSHNVIGQRISPAFKDDLKQFKMGTVKSIEDVEILTDEKSSLSSIQTANNIVLKDSA